jgi:hypothetical protein
MSLKAGVRVGRVLQPYDALQRLYAIIEIEPVDDISDWHLIRITTPRTDGIHVVGYLGNRDAWITKRAAAATSWGHPGTKRTPIWIASRAGRSGSGAIWQTDGVPCMSPWSDRLSKNSGEPIMLRAIANAIRRALGGLVHGAFWLVAEPFNIFGRLFSGGGASNQDTAQNVAQRTVNAEIAKDNERRTAPDLDQPADVKRTAMRLARGQPTTGAKLSGDLYDALKSMPQALLRDLGNAPTPAIQSFTTGFHATVATKEKTVAPAAEERCITNLSARIAAKRAKEAAANDYSDEGRGLQGRRVN